MSIFYIKQELDKDLNEFAQTHPACGFADIDTCNHCIEISSMITEMKVYLCESKKYYENCINK